MSKVRIISQGTTGDVERLTAFLERLCAHVEQHEPGMFAYECFADAATGQVLWLETYRDEAAILAHVEGLTSSGLMDELMQHYVIDKLTALGEVTDAGVRAVFQQFGAAVLVGLDGFTRQ